MSDYKKVCTKCGDEKTSEEFGTSNRLADGHTVWCLRCRRNAHILRLYGITMDDFEEMLEAQDHACALCLEKESATLNGMTTRLCIDHDHETGVVRGLLCRGCNRTFGAVENRPDPVEWMKRAVAYMEVDSD